MAQPYLTANRFNALGGFGIDASFLTGPQLRATLARASQLVDRWTSQALIPSPYSFRGGAVTNEQYRFNPPNPLIAYAGSRRVFPAQTPLLAVTAFALDFTNGYHITMDPANDVYVNRTEGWFEIVASQPTIIGYPPIGYWFGLYQPVATYSYTYGYSAEATEEPLDALSPALFYGSCGQWDSTVAPVVTVGGVVKTVTTDYTVNYADGSVTLAAAPAPGVEVAATYTSLVPSAVEQATGIIAADLLSKSRNMQRMPGLSSLKVAEVSLTRMVGTQGRYTTRNGVSIPEDAAVLLGGVNRGKAA